MGQFCRTSYLSDYDEATLVCLVILPVLTHLPALSTREVDLDEPLFVPLNLTSIYTTFVSADRGSERRTVQSGVN